MADITELIDFGMGKADEGPENLQLPDPLLYGYYKDISKRVFYLDTEIIDETVELAKQILRCNQEDKGLEVSDRQPIYIYINSIGGDVQTMWTIINTILLSKTPVYTIVYCNALSAAAFLLVAGHKRYALPGSTILVHSGSCSFNGDVEKVESAKKYYDALSKRVNTFLLQRSKIPEKDLKRKGAVDWYMTAEEALSYGLIDEIVSDLDTILP